MLARSLANSRPARYSDAEGSVRRWPKARPTPDLLARPAVCGRPTSMILTRAPSRVPFTLAVKITPGPQTCSRAPVGSPASPLRFDHRSAWRLPCGRKTHAAETPPPRPRYNCNMWGQTPRNRCKTPVCALVTACATDLPRSYLSAAIESISGCCGGLKEFNM